MTKFASSAAVMITFDAMLLRQNIFFAGSTADTLAIGTPPGARQLRRLDVCIQCRFCGPECGVVPYLACNNTVIKHNFETSPAGAGFFTTLSQRCAGEVVKCAASDCTGDCTS